MIKKILVTVLAIVMVAFLVGAFTPQENIKLRGYYNITGINYFKGKNRFAGINLTENLDMNSNDILNASKITASDWSDVNVNASQVDNFDISAPNNYYYANVINMSDESVTYVDGRNLYAEEGSDQEVTIAGENITSGTISSNYIEDAFLKNDGDSATGIYNFGSGDLFLNDTVGIGTAEPFSDIPMTIGDRGVIKIYDEQNNPGIPEIGFLESTYGTDVDNSSLSKGKIKYDVDGDNFLFSVNSSHSLEIYPQKLFAEDANLDMNDNILKNANFSNNKIKHLTPKGYDITRPIWSDSRTSVTVCSSGCNYSSIQKAVNKIPLFVSNNYRVYVQEGNYNEDVVIPIFFEQRINPAEQEESVGVKIEGNTTKPTNVNVSSFFTQGAYGTIALQINGFNMKQPNPYDNEGTPMGMYGVSEVGLNKISFNDVNTSKTVHAITCYHSDCQIQGVDLGNDLFEYGIDAKHNAEVQTNDYNWGYGVKGNVTEYVFIGDVHFENSNNLNGNKGICRDKMCYEIKNSKLYGVDKINNWIDASALQQNLMGFWGFEQNGQASNSNITYDSGRYGNDGTRYDANTTNTDGNTLPPWVAGKSGTALEFNGVDDYVDLGSPIDLIEGGSYSVWIKPDSSSSSRTIIGNTVNSSNRFYLSVNNNEIVAYFYDGTIYKVSKSINNKEWQHVSAVWNGSNVKIYVNSIEGAGDGSIETRADVNLFIGARTDGADYFNGTIDDTRIYNRSLSQDEIRALNKGLGNEATGHLALK